MSSQGADVEVVSAVVVVVVDDDADVVVVVVVIDGEHLQESTVFSLIQETK